MFRWSPSYPQIARARSPETLSDQGARMLSTATSSGAMSASAPLSLPPLLLNENPRASGRSVPPVSIEAKPPAGRHHAEWSICPAGILLTLIVKGMTPLSLTRRIWRHRGVSAGRRRIPPELGQDRCWQQLAALVLVSGMVAQRLPGAQRPIALSRLSWRQLRGAGTRILASVVARQASA